MPHNRETNRKFGFFKSLCCGKEIVIPEGNQFPDCPNHPKLTTIWKPIVNDNIADNKMALDAAAPRFKIGDSVTIVAPGPRKGKRGGVVKIVEGTLDPVHRYHVIFPNGTWTRCFGFELELLQDESSKCA